MSYYIIIYYNKKKKIILFARDIITSIYGSRFFRNACLPVDTPEINRRGKSDASREVVFRDKYINVPTRGETPHARVN